MDDLKNYCWMAGTSTKLDETKAKVLRLMMETTCNLGVAGTADEFFIPARAGAYKSSTIRVLLSVNLRKTSSAFFLTLDYLSHSY